LVVNGGEHFPDDIEATIRGVTGGRAVAVSVGDTSSDLIAIFELKNGHGADRETMRSLETVKGRVASAITEAHGRSFADVVPVAVGSIPITTSGKVRRSACSEMYRRNEFTRLDASDGIELLDRSVIVSGIKKVMSQISDTASKLGLRSYWIVQNILRTGLVSPCTQTTVARTSAPSFPILRGVP
jgi:hypothetical protein